MRTKDPETVTICGQEWTRIPRTSDGLVSTDGLVVMSESRLQSIEQRRRVEAEQAAARQREIDAAARAWAALSAGPRIVLCGTEWVRSPDDPQILVNVENRHALRETTVRGIHDERAQEAAKTEALRMRAAAPASVETRIAELERQLAASRTGKN